MVHALRLHDLQYSQKHFLSILPLRTNVYLEERMCITRIYTSFCDDRVDEKCNCVRAHHLYTNNQEPVAAVETDNRTYSPEPTSTPMYH